MNEERTPPAGASEGVTASVGFVLEALEESDDRPRAQVEALLETLGYPALLELLAETERVENAGGMLRPDGARRSRGGVFFVLARKRLGRKDRARIFQPQSAPPTVRPALKRRRIVDAAVLPVATSRAKPVRSAGGPAEASGGAGAADAAASGVLASDAAASSEAASSEAASSEAASSEAASSEAASSVPPAPASVRGPAGQRLVRLPRRPVPPVARAVPSETPPPPPRSSRRRAEEAPSPEPASSPAGSVVRLREHVAPPPDPDALPPAEPGNLFAGLEETLLAVVGERLGLDHGQIALCIHGADTPESREQIGKRIARLGPDGREVALRMVRLALGR